MASKYSLFLVAIFNSCASRTMHHAIIRNSTSESYPAYVQNISHVATQEDKDLLGSYLAFYSAQELLMDGKSQDALIAIRLALTSAPSEGLKKKGEVE